MVFLRGHYVIDLFAGIFFGHYFWILAERSSSFVDSGFFRLGLLSRYPHMKEPCQGCHKQIIELEEETKDSLKAKPFFEKKHWCSSEKMRLSPFQSRQSQNKSNME